MRDQMEKHTSLHLWLTLVVALAVVAGVGATLIAGRNGPPPGAAVSSVVTNTTSISTSKQAGLSCPSDAAFSPDGARIVVIGLLGAALGAGSCPAETDDASAAAAAVIFDAATGQLVRSIPLDPLVAGSNVSQGHVVYSGLGWSPDGRHIALVFTHFGDGSPAPENVSDSGLLLLDPATTAGTILRGDSGYFAAASGVSSGLPVWHIGQQAELPAFLPAAGLAYAWSPDGTPYPILPAHGALDQLPDTAGARYPVGAPDGGSHYTIWQPGLVIGTGVGMGTVDSQIAYISAFPAWSPDGANVTLMVTGVTLHDDSASAQMGRSTTMRQQLATISQLPAVPTPPLLATTPPRDAALSAVRSEVGNLGWAVVAWNPTGSLLASTNCTSAGAPRVDLRDTVTGQVEVSAEVELAPGDMGCRGSSSASAVGAYPTLGLTLSWSPDGAQILQCDRGGNSLTLYHVRSARAS